MGAGSHEVNDQEERRDKHIADKEAETAKVESDNGVETARIKQTTDLAVTNNNRDIAFHKDDTDFNINDANNLFKSGESTKMYNFKNLELNENGRQFDLNYNFKQSELQEKIHEFDLTNQLEVGKLELQGKQMDYTHEEKRGFMKGLYENNQQVTKSFDKIVSNTSVSTDQLQAFINPANGHTSSTKV